MDQPKLELYFEEPRLAMTALGRLWVRSSFYVGYLVLGVLTFLFLLSKIGSGFFHLGILLALFLTDRFFHLGEGEEAIMYLPKTGGYNLAELLAPKTLNLLESSLGRSSLSGRDFCFVLLLKLSDRKEIQAILTRLEIKKEDFLSLAERELSRDPLSDQSAILAFIAQLMLYAYESASKTNSRFIEPKDLLVGLSNMADARLDKLFSLFSVDKNDLLTASIFSRVQPGFFSFFFDPREAAGRYSYRLRHRVMNRAWTAKPTPVLDAFSEDLTDLARTGEVGFLAGHEREYERLLDVLARPEKPLALLVGDPGVGKSSIVRHLAFAMVKDNVPKILFDKRLVSLSISRLVAGVSGGDLQGRMVRIVEEILRAGNIILYLPDIDNLVKTSSGEYMSISDTLIPLIRKGLIPVIGGTFPREFKKYIESHTDFASAFEIIRIPEVSEADAMKILTYMALGFELEYHITITFGAVRRAVDLAHKYFRDRPLPSSAEDLLKEALGEAVRLKEKVLTKETLVKVAERKVNIPIHAFDKEEAGKLLNLEVIIHKKLVDQSEAVSAVASALRAYRSGLTRRGGPIASFLFIGPTGVGKTELSKILAEIQFGSASLLTRFDMSEYQDKQSLFRFIGSPDGMVNGALTDAILEKPYSIVLLDEFEKAHPDILNLFLQVFDDGRLTDNLGRVADFQNAIVIATSNAHSEFILSSLEAGKSVKEISAEVKHNLMDYFKPELLNRFSNIVIFEALAPGDIQKIAALEVKILADNVFEAQHITLKVSNEALKKIGELGFSKTFGARPLRGVISERLRGPLAEQILRGDIEKNDTVLVTVLGGEFVFKKAEASEAS
ncbi:MAG: ATP-dependent Clp protease ATP-binding subunit [bacterium]|nr:ATP-dependent Clp protease ATP-binding subunit [bacterium]